ncbi:MAG: DUF1080 domain-containing protein [Massilia sp.]
MLLLSGCAGAPVAQGEAPMFNGRDFSGWELVTVPATPLADSFTLKPDGVIASTGQPTGYLASVGSYTNYKLHVEWRWSGKPGNAGVLLHIQGGPKDRAWPLSLQVQTKNGNAGDVLPMAGASFAEPLTSLPSGPTPIKGFTGANSEKAVGEWNSADIVSRDGSIEVSINGVAQNKVTQVKPASGRIGFQLEGTPFEMRKVTITPLN